MDARRRVFCNVFARTLFAIAPLAHCSPRPPPALHAPPAPAIAIPRDIDVAAITLDVTVAPDHRTLHGTEHIRWTNRTRIALGDLWWHLYANAFSSPDTLFARTGGYGAIDPHDLAYGGHISIARMTLANGEALVPTGEPLDPTELHTRLPAPLAIGGSIEIDVEFTTALPRPVSRSGAWQDFTFAGQWFPKLARCEDDGSWGHFAMHGNTEFYADFARYDVTVHTPRGDVVAATGSLVARSDEANATRRRFVADAVHDFAFTAWAGYATRSMASDGVTITSVFPHGMERVALRAEQTVVYGLRRMGQLYGRYPYATLTLVHPPDAVDEVSGMEYPTLITVGAPWFLPDAVHDVEYVTLHELAHQWFYGSIATDEATHPALDEGLTEYAGCRVLEEYFGRDHGLIDTGRASVGCRAFEGAMGALGTGGPLDRAASDYASFGDYSVGVYRRSAAMWETLEDTAPPGALDRALHAYALHRRFAHPTAGDLVNDVSAVLGPSLLDTAFARDPRFDVSVASVDGNVVGVHCDGPCPPVRVRLDGEARNVEWAEPARTLTATHPVHAVAIEPDAARALDTDRLDDARLAAPASDAGFTVRLASWAVEVLRWIGP